MRRDMSKVVTERPRRGHHAPSKKTSGKVHRDKYDDDDHGPTRHKVSRRGQYGWDAKEFSDLLGPLRGFLKKQIGRPWSKVHSELCQFLDKRSISGQHIWDHVKWEVDTKAYVKDGYVMSSNVPSQYTRGNRVDGLYVHPINGLLCRATAKKYPSWRDNEQTPKKIDINALEHLERVEGIWYHFKYEMKPQFYSVWDKDAGKTVWKRGKDAPVLAQKKQLSSKELAEAGLCNAPEGKGLSRREQSRINKKER